MGNVGKMSDLVFDKSTVEIINSSIKLDEYWKERYEVYDKSIEEAENSAIKLDVYELAVLINALSSYKNIQEKISYEDLYDYTVLKQKLCNQYELQSGEGFDTE